MHSSTTDKLTAARIRLLLEHPLYAQIILLLEPLVVEWCPTAATDGKYFFYNPEFIDRLSKDELVFLCGHEVLHCVFQHMGRRGHRDKALFNMAADYTVNYVLIQSKVGQAIDKCLYDPRFTDNYTVEEIYDLLDKEVKKIELPLDMHLDGEGDGPCDPRDGPPTYTDAEEQAIADGLRAALLEGVKQQEAKTPGSTPAGILRMVERMLGSKINWREMLDNVLRSAIKYDYTYTRISRRSYTSDLILPGSDVMDRVEAVACLDGSGSTTQEMIADFLGECRGIMQTFRDFKLTVMTFDTKVYNVQEFTPDNADDIDSYEFRGGGGTSPSCCWRYLREHDIVPHKLLVFTDGYVGSDWGSPDEYDTLFIIHSNPGVNSPYGKTTHYEPRTTQ